jgi:hypothetical protein
MNNWRADWARDVVEFFEQYGERPHPNATEDERCKLAEQNMSDLISDFAHYCDRIGVRMQNVLRTASSHYIEETKIKPVKFCRSV